MSPMASCYRLTIKGDTMNELGLILALLDTAAAVATAAGVIWVGSKLKRK